MSLNSLKLTDNMIAQKGVVAAPDHLVGNAQDNKKVFDRLIRESLKQLFNGLIDALSSAGGAGEIGAAVVGVSGDTVQRVLTAMKTLLDSKAADADMEAALLLKADAAVAAAHFKTVEFDPDTGKFTFTRENGSKVEIDTALEKVATNWTYDAETQALVLTLADGSTQRVSLSDFITTTEFVSSESVQFSVTGGKVTARVLPGGIDETMLSSALLTMLRDYVSQAAASATAAGASESQAKEYKNSAASDAAAAKQSAAAAKESETKAKASETKAAESETDAASEADRAKSEADRAEDAANRAADVVGGDYITEEEAQELFESHNADEAAHPDIREYVDKAIENIPSPESDVFYATYGETTTAELEAALNAGKAVYCVNGAYTANFLRRNTAATRHIFGFQGGTQGEYLCENDVWSTSTVSFAPKSHAASHKTGGTDAIAPEDFGAAPAYTYGTTDLTAGTSELATGKLHFVYE
ncbi:MAG: hypothetical protein IJY96_04250 [Oscillospiraceae bacterium]|nr:hypothetical protein [Oscillospiraceae bacterium]